MPRPKAVNKPAIKARYLKGEKPKDIGPDYGLTAKQVSDLVRREGWKRKKTQIIEKVDVFVEDELKRQRTLVSQLYEQMLGNIVNDMAVMGATIQDGEGFPNKYHLKAWELGLAAYLKPTEAQQSTEESQDKRATIEGLDVRKV